MQQTLFFFQPQWSRSRFVLWALKQCSNAKVKTWFNRPSWTDLPCCWLISWERTLYVYCIFNYSLFSNTKQNWYCTVLLIGCWWGLGQQGVTSVISLQRSLLRYSLCTAHTTLRVTSELVNPDQNFKLPELRYQYWHCSLWQKRSRQQRIITYSKQYSRVFTVLYLET